MRVTDDEVIAFDFKETPGYVSFVGQNEYRNQITISNANGATIELSNVECNFLTPNCQGLRATDSIIKSDNVIEVGNFEVTSSSIDLTEIKVSTSCILSEIQQPSSNIVIKGISNQNTFYFSTSYPMNVLGNNNLVLTFPKGIQISVEFSDVSVGGAVRMAPIYSLKFLNESSITLEKINSIWGRSSIVAQCYDKVTYNCQYNTSIPRLDIKLYNTTVEIIGEVGPMNVLSMSGQNTIINTNDEIYMESILVLSSSTLDITPSAQIDKNIIHVVNLFGYSNASITTTRAVVIAIVNNFDLLITRSVVSSVLYEDDGEVYFENGIIPFIFSIPKVVVTNILHISSSSLVFNDLEINEKSVIRYNVMVLAGFHYSSPIIVNGVFNYTEYINIVFTSDEDPQNQVTDIDKGLENINHLIGIIKFNGNEDDTVFQVDFGPLGDTESMLQKGIQEGVYGISIPFSLSNLFQYYCIVPNDYFKDSCSGYDTYIITQDAQPDFTANLNPYTVNVVIHVPMDLNEEYQLDINSLSNQEVKIISYGMKLKIAALNAETTFSSLTLSGSFEFAQNNEKREIVSNSFTWINGMAPESPITLNIADVANIDINILQQISFSQVRELNVTTRDIIKEIVYKQDGWTLINLYDYKYNVNASAQNTFFTYDNQDSYNMALDNSIKLSLESEEQTATFTSISAYGTGNFVFANNTGKVESPLINIYCKHVILDSEVYSIPAQITGYQNIQSACYELRSSEPKKMMGEVCSNAQMLYMNSQETLRVHNVFLSGPAGIYGDKKMFIENLFVSAFSCPVLYDIEIETLSLFDETTTSIDKSIVHKIDFELNDIGMAPFVTIGDSMDNYSVFININARDNATIERYKEDTRIVQMADVSKMRGVRKCIYLFSV